MLRASVLAGVAAMGLSCGPIDEPAEGGVDGGVDAGPAFGCIPFPEELAGDVVFEKGCYLALLTPAIAPGTTLTLRPGVKIYFGMAVELRFTGDQALSALGSEADPIILTGAMKYRGFWKGLRFEKATAASSLEWVTVEYAGFVWGEAEPTAVKVQAAPLAITHTTLSQSGGWGLWADQLQTFTQNTLSQNVLGPASLDAEVVGALDDASTFVGNDVERLQVRGARISKETTWRALDVPYSITSRLASEQLWTLAPGVTLELMPRASIVVSGDAAGLHAVGTPELPIVITGAEKSRGSWGALSFEDTLNAANALEHCVVEYGGGENRAGLHGMISAQGDTQLSVTSSTVRHSAQWGIWLGGATIGAVSGNTYKDNASGALFRHP